MTPRSKPAVLLVVAALAGCDTAGFKRSYLALDSEGHRKRDSFFTDTESMFCVAELASGVDDVTVQGVFELRAIFSSESGERVPIQRPIGSAEVAPGAGEDLIASFELLRANAEEPYQAGDYACLLYLNGELESELTFPIHYPSCPAAPIEAGFRCAGFVLNGQVCPGASGNPCVCDASGTWQC